EWDLFSDRMLEVMEERALKANLENLKVIKATLGSDVGIMGAAAAAWEICR
ncbi:MAG TPA: ROK family protein, partial [Thermoanaerobacterales bacterium]|nr:ROK family protein [Thermoanaerobacterales bacterium]